jgi:3-phytase
LSDLAPEGLPVLAGETGDRSEPMGVALYKRAGDGAVFAIVAPKGGSPTDYLWQYRLETDRAGRITTTPVRRLGRFSQSGEIEAVAVDDALGYVYYSDEGAAIRKYHADPSHPDSARELAAFGTEGYQGDREGLAIYETDAATGYLVSSDQVAGGTRLKLYRREGAPASPHDHSEVLTLETVSDSTDGLEATSRILPGFPRGLLVMMNSGARNFLLYDWRAIESAMGGEASSMIPVANVARSLACHATRTGPPAPVLSASALAGSITRNTCAKSATVLMP